MQQLHESIPPPRHLIRSMFPPWRQLEHPLVQFEIRRADRAPNLGWTLMVVLFFGLVSLDLALLDALLSEQQYNRPFTEQVLPILGSTAAATLSLYIALLHWRLIITLAARTARIVAGRRQRGDWELIAVSPIPRIRWLQAQLVGLGWQVFPLVRQMIIANFLLLLLSGGYLLYYYLEEVENNMYYESQHTPVAVYALAISLIGTVAALFPLLEVPLYTAVGLLASSRSQRVTMSMLYSFFGIFITRILLAAALIYGAVFIFISVGVLLDGLGVLEGFDLRELQSVDTEFYLVALLYTCIAIPIFSLFIEWLPAIPVLLMGANLETDSFAWFFISTLLLGALVYIYLPMRLLRWYVGRAVKRLNRRE